MKLLLGKASSKNKAFISTFFINVKKSFVRVVYLFTTLIFLSVHSVHAAQEISPDEITATAEQAFIYGFPIVLNYEVFHGFFLDPKSKGYRGELNKIHNDARVFTPADTTVQTPNSDTPYSMVGTDLRAEPLVLCLPKIDKSRYYDIQFTDMYTHNYAYLGSRTSGNGAGCYLIAGPSWQGKAPKGIKQTIQSETPFNFVIIRTQLFNKTDLDNVVKIQKKYSVKTLSEYTGKAQATPVEKIEWPALTPHDFDMNFVEKLNFLLGYMVPKANDEKELAARAALTKIGIGESNVDFATFSKEQKAAFVDGIKLGHQKVVSYLANYGSKVNGWQIGSLAGDRQFFNGDWMVRAAGASAGIYGNSQAEAVYPITKQDINGIPLNGETTNYTMTFEKDQLPPAHAFWSITMYDANTQFLVENPINRYLINSPMLNDLKKNADGSLTLYIQKDSPGKDKEANWLPAPNGPIYIAMRIYWPSTDKSSIFPLDNPAWLPPGLIPVSFDKGNGQKRIGDLTLENVIRTDERYRKDPLFQGPRGVAYWNNLEYPSPIQNPNLWPDLHSTYFISTLQMPAGSKLTFKGQYPHSRYFKYAFYQWKVNTFVSIGQDLKGKDIAPNKGSVNPYVVGNDRHHTDRDYTITVIADDLPENPKKRAVNTLYVGKDGGKIQMVIRTYLPDQGFDGAGLAYSFIPSVNQGLPRYTGELADGTQLSSKDVIEQFVVKEKGALPTPVTEQQWAQLVKASPAKDPELTLETTPARKDSQWKKYWSFKRSIVGEFMSAEEQDKIPYAGPIDGGGDPSTQYMYVFISRVFGDVYVIKGKMPSFPDTYAGERNLGANIMPDAQTQYWSIVSCESAPSGQCVDGLMDMQVPLDADRNYTLVVSSKADRPANATLENGVAWIEWSEAGEGLSLPENRKSFGLLMMRYMANKDRWQESPTKITKPGDEQKIMQSYYPKGEYTTKAAFESNYKTNSKK